MDENLENLIRQEEVNLKELERTFTEYLRNFIRPYHLALKRKKKDFEFQKSDLVELKEEVEILLNKKELLFKLRFELENQINDN